ncbi:MAG: AtpZ/AtpI family protein [Clostridia bacterium]|nr:AtpZ/AtpI family protein [Clostridia bacterium]
MDMKKGQKADLKNLVLFSQLGLSVVSPIVVCAVIGFLLKKYADMPSWGVAIFIVVGLLSGMSSAWRLIKRMSKISSENDTEAKQDERKEE